jgi:MFS family permease
MGYFSEFRTGWKPLLAATLGMCAGFSNTSYVVGEMAPRFLKDLHWAPGDFAKVGSLSILLSLFIPIAGRLADVWGVRRTAKIGVVVMPLALIAASLMTNDIRQYYVIFAVQAIFGITTTATVLSRLVVASFARARGLALAIAASGPNIAGVLAGTLLHAFNEAHGWRSGYLAVAVFALVGGIITLGLIPAENVDAASTAGRAPAKRSGSDYPKIFRTSAFWILVVAIILTNLHQPLIQTQLSLVVTAQGVSGKDAASILSVFAGAVILGRFVCGGAIDRLPGHIIAVVGMGLPSIGLFLLASSHDSTATVLTAMVLIGFAFGAEGDLISVLVSRAFGVSVYSTVMGMVIAALGLAAASGALALGIMLNAYHEVHGSSPLGSYDLFLNICGCTALVGCFLFLLLPREKTVKPPEIEPLDSSAAVATPQP